MAMFPMRFLQKQSWPWPRHSARPQGPTAAAPPHRSSRRRTQARWPRGVRAAWWERLAAARHLLCPMIGWTPVLRLSVGDRTLMIHILCPVSPGHLMAYIHCLYVITGIPHILIWFDLKEQLFGQCDTGVSNCSENLIFSCATFWPD